MVATTIPAIAAAERFWPDEAPPPLLLLLLLPELAYSTPGMLERSLDA
jgi:hypothetical protein